MATAMANYKTDSEEEALFRSYPYAVYLVQSPSVTVTDDQEAAGLALSRYSSSHGSNNSFLHLARKNDGKCGDIVKIDRDRVCEIDGGGGGDREEEGNEAGWIKYLSFRYSNSGWWILLQLSWRFLVSLLIALLVFYVAAKPPPPGVAVKVTRIREFRLGEGVDTSGVATKILTFNTSIHLIIDNNSNLFPLHVHPPTLQLLFATLPLAISRGREVHVGSDGIRVLRLNIGTRNKAMYGAGRNMQDMMDSGKEMPLTMRVSLRSSYNVMWGMIRPKFHHRAECTVVVGDKYDKEHRTQIFNTKCIITS